MTTSTAAINRAAVRDRLRTENDQLIELLRGLSSTQWQAESLCADWTVREVSAHLVAQHLTGQLRFFGRLIQAGGAVDAFNAAGIEALQHAGPGDLLAGLEHGYRLPFFKLNPQLALFETVVHQQDIRRPLGATRDIRDDTLRVVLDVALKASAARANGLRLEAIDAGWVRGDNGPEVTGPGEALLMALCGRPAALVDLHGAGLGILTSRIAGDADAR